MQITFTGDILIYKSQDKLCRKKDGKYNYKPIFEHIKPLLEKADYVVGSFETTTSGAKAGYTHTAISFNTPDEILPALKWAGFDLLTTANNHCFDRGWNGHMRTIEKIAEYGLECTGTRLSLDQPAYVIKNFDNTRIAFISYTYGTNSIANEFVIPKGKEYLVNLTRPQDQPIKRSVLKRIAKAVLYPFLKKNKHSIIQDSVSNIELTNERNVLYEKQMIDTIYDAKKKADIVIFCLHSGGQFNSKVGPYTQHLFDIIADAGVDAIVCNHAHTTLPIYRHKGCLIASALGNFSFVPGEGYWVEGVMAEYSALLNIEVKNKKIIDYNVDICKCVKDEYGLAITIPTSEDDVNNRIVLRKLGL